MKQAHLTWIADSIWNIAVILPMTVLRRLGAGQALYNTSPFTMRDLVARASQQQLMADFEAYHRREDERDGRPAVDGRRMGDEVVCQGAAHEVDVDVRDGGLQRVPCPAPREVGRHVEIGRESRSPARACPQRLRELGGRLPA